MMMKPHITQHLTAVFTAIFLTVFCLSAPASPFNGRFRSVPLTSGETTSIFSIVQDSYGFVWMGTDNGLFRHDGYGCRHYSWRQGDSASLVNNVVNALLYDSDQERLYVGTDEGISVYDPLKDSFRTLTESAGKHVKAFLNDDGKLYAATTEGLLCLNGDCVGTLFLEHAACVRKIGKDIWAGSYDRLFHVVDGKVHAHDLGDILAGNNVLVLDVCEDALRPGSLLLGTETGLVGYDPSAESSYGRFLGNIPVKTFLYSDETLWIGSDNGLMLRGKDGRISYYRHQVGNVSSLPNNVVWSITENNDGEIWLGTDHGAALAESSSLCSYIGVDVITGKDDGLDISVMETDGYGNLWLGGRNGLVCCDVSLSGGVWLKADSGGIGRRLSHNKVRDIFDDGDNLWIASDGGLDRYDHKSGKITGCHVCEPTGRYSSNWMYDIAEDSSGRLWLGTYDGGIFVVDKKKAVEASGSIMCEKHLSTSSLPSLSDNIVRNLAVCGNRLYADAGSVIDMIDVDTWTAERLPVPDGAFILCLLADGDRVWAGTDKGLYYIEDRQILKAGENELYVHSIALHEGNVYVASQKSVSVYYPDKGEWQHKPVGGFPLMSALACGERLYFGTVDGVLTLSPDSFEQPRSARRMMLTGLWLNDELVLAGKAYGGNVILENNIAFTDRIELPHDKNSFALSFSEFIVNGAAEPLLYRLKGFDDKWIALSEGDNRAVFINVPAGDYVFEVSHGNTGLPALSVQVEVEPVWYATTWAYAVYVLLGIALCFAVFYYMRMRHQLQLEHIERDRAIEMADSKTEFLANMAHEFKSPLSIIIGFVGRMSASESDALRTRELQTVQRNAEKMHLLLNRMMEFNGSGTSSLFMPAAVSIGELAKEVWTRYSYAFADKDISARFVSDDIGYIFMVDRVQMESVFQNLLSNALKFTPRGGSILMSVTVAEETSDMIYADIKVEDTGCGIKEDELPNIFDRYYMAPSGKSFNTGGSGIGLHLVKDIVEMHKGKIMVASQPGKGSCFTVRLSTMKADSFVLREAVETDLSLHSLSKVWRHDRKPIILIVEDNPDIRDFIVASLGKDYTFLAACEGKTALDILKTEKVDIVVTDIAMPGMDGLTMSRTIRNTIDTAFLPIIILTGKNDAGTQIRSFEYADAFISKPFDLNYLNSRIIQLLIKHEQYLEKMRQQKMLVPPEQEAVESPDSKFLQEMMDIVLRHIDDSEFSVSVLCEESHWSDKQVYRKIKQLTGKTVSEFIRDVRLEKAAAYLSQHKLTVNEVMYKVGFTTASYFSKCFKEKYGKTPSEW